MHVIDPDGPLTIPRVWPTLSIASEEGSLVHRILRLLNGTDPELAAHGQRAAWLASDIARQMTLDADTIGRLGVAAQLHDIGKIMIPRDILDEPGPLSDEQWIELRQHPLIGYEMVRDRVPEEVARIVLTHHERFDGTGYPNAIAAKAIPIEARVLQVADAIDAITSSRPYQQALPIDYALDEMVRCSGTQFDPGVVEATMLLASSTSWISSRFADQELFLEEIAV